MKNWMIYGANGYTGRLVAEQAKRRGHEPVLGGRSPAVQALAAELGLEARVFDLSAPEALRESLHGMKAVLHCAGPFSATSKPMLDACLEVGAHYLDVTGEISVFEAVHSRSAEIARKGVVAIPGVGFDVVPSDCLAAMLRERLPDATHLALAFYTRGGVSPGTAKTMIEGVAAGGAVRRDGKIVTVPSNSSQRQVDFGRGPRLVTQIPWGDVSTAFYSTGIPNIEVFTVVPKAQQWVSKVLAPLARVPQFQRILQRAAGKLTQGPSQDDRERLRCYLWGEVRNAAGRTESLRLEIPEGYGFTATSALTCAELVLKGALKLGALTPSLAFGKDFVLTLPGTRLL